MHVSEWFLKTTFCDPGPDARFRLARILFVIVLYPFNAKQIEKLVLSSLFLYFTGTDNEVFPEQDI